MSKFIKHSSDLSKEIDIWPELSNDIIEKLAKLVVCFELIETECTHVEDIFDQMLDYGIDMKIIQNEIQDIELGATLFQHAIVFEEIATFENICSINYFRPAIANTKAVTFLVALSEMVKIFRKGMLLKSLLALFKFLISLYRKIQRK